ncbi:alanine racemase [Fusibacter sp. JL298sf-3]
MKISELTTPTLLVDIDKVLENCEHMQRYAQEQGVQLRPHAKTHKMPFFAQKQIALGASGVAVAKVSEAESMARHGVKDIFIANEIVGSSQLECLKQLNKRIELSFGVDCVDHIKKIDQAFKYSRKPAQILIEIEVGEERSGVVEEEAFLELLAAIKQTKNVCLKGVFSHDGHSYEAETIDELRKIHFDSQEKTLYFAAIAKSQGFQLQVVSIGSTPTLIRQWPILQGITEIRPGTYIFMDSSQAHALGDESRCAATVLASVISKPTESRVVLDVGAKGLTQQVRSIGLLKTRGMGTLKGYGETTIHRMFDEHAIVEQAAFSKSVQIGDKVEIIPNHICPVVNLYDKVHLVRKGLVVGEAVIACRGNVQ